MSNTRTFFAAAAFVVVCLVLYPMFVGGTSTVPDKLLQEIVYVDRETGETFLLRARLSPEFNPDTGEQTLIPGMYCEKCKKWKPAGPMELLQTGRFPHKCPIHKTPLSREGPMPE